MVLVVKPSNLVIIFTFESTYRYIYTIFRNKNQSNLYQI
jgi:hypothetical protein